MSAPFDAPIDSILVLLAQASFRSLSFKFPRGRESSHAQLQPQCSSASRACASVRVRLSAYGDKMERKHWLNSFEFLQRVAENLQAKLKASSSA